MSDKEIIDHRDGTCTVYQAGGVARTEKTPDCRTMRMDIHSWIRNMQDKYYSGYYSCFPADFRYDLDLLATRCTGEQTMSEQSEIAYMTRNLIVLDRVTGGPLCSYNHWIKNNKGAA